MSDVTKLPTGYNPKIEPLKDLKLPIELRNYRGEIIASIFYLPTRDEYYFTINSQEYGISSDFTTCLEQGFGKLYQQMQDYRKMAEQFWEFKKMLKGLVK